MTGRITGTGSFVPEINISNEELSEIVDTSDAWIYSRTGIRSRRIAGKETVAEMGAEAARRAMEKAGALAEEIELLIVATCSGEFLFPSTACQIQKEIGARQAVVFDISAACSGFLFGLNTAWAYLQSGIYKKALIIGTEKLSRLLNWDGQVPVSCLEMGQGLWYWRQKKQGLRVWCSMQMEKRERFLPAGKDMWE